MNAIHRTRIDAGSVLGVDARLGNYIGHKGFCLLRIYTTILLPVPVSPVPHGTAHFSKKPLARGGKKWGGGKARF
jgi:hypothetical protein